MKQIKFTQFALFSILLLNIFSCKKEEPTIQQSKQENQQSNYNATPGGEDEDDIVVGVRVKNQNGQAIPNVLILLNGTSNAYSGITNALGNCDFSLNLGTYQYQLLINNIVIKTGDIAFISNNQQIEIIIP